MPPRSAERVSCGAPGASLGSVAGASPSELRADPTDAPSLATGMPRSDASRRVGTIIGTGQLGSRDQRSALAPIVGLPAVASCSECRSGSGSEARRCRSEGAKAPSGSASTESGRPRGSCEASEPCPAPAREGCGTRGATAECGCAPSRRKGRRARCGATESRLTRGAERQARWLAKRWSCWRARRLAKRWSCWRAEHASTAAQCGRLAECRAGSRGCSEGRWRR